MMRRVLALIAIVGGLTFTQTFTQFTQRASGGEWYGNGYVSPVAYSVGSPYGYYYYAGYYPYQVINYPYGLYGYYFPYRYSYAGYPYGYYGNYVTYPITYPSAYVATYPSAVRDRTDYRLPRTGRVQVSPGECGHGNEPIDGAGSKNRSGRATVGKRRRHASTRSGGKRQLTDWHD